MAETGWQERNVEEDDGEHPCQDDGLHQPRRQAGVPPPLQTLRVRLQVDGGYFVENLHLCSNEFACLT